MKNYTMIVLNLNNRNQNKFTFTVTSISVLIIKESIENISLNGGKIRLVENDILTLIDIDEKYTMCSKL